MEKLSKESEANFFVEKEMNEYRRERLKNSPGIIVFIGTFIIRAKIGLAPCHHGLEYGNKALS